MDIRIIHFYPDLMSLYGSYANVSVLKRYWEALGHTVTVEPVVPGQAVSLTGAGFLFMGAGTERSQRAAGADLLRFGPELRAAAGAGLPMLFAGTALELLGASVTDRSGETWDGVGLADFTSVQGGARILGDVYGATDLFQEPVVGFMNKCTRLLGVKTPLLTSLAMGFGNEAVRGPEGFHRQNVFGSELTGPILVKNPRLLETVADAVLRYLGGTPPADRPVDRWAEAGYAFTAEQLRLRCHQG